MTREEATEEIKRIKQGMQGDFGWNKSGIEALDMAIEALQMEPCDDAISRQAVLAMMQMRMGAKELYRAVYDLPSVQPEQKMGKWIFHKSFDNGHKNCNECIECSQCHTWLGHDCYAKTPYCPMCGAKMKESEDNE